MIRARKQRQGGWAVILMLAIVAAIATLASVSLMMRRSELKHPPRRLCRLEARLAAESALNRARARWGARVRASDRISGRLDSRSRYELRGDSSSGEWVARGWCGAIPSAPATEIRARPARGKLRFSSWNELRGSTDG